MKVLFVHGWSVSDTATYGGLPERLKKEASLEVQEVFLGKYISFRNEVRLDDLARALAVAIERDVRLKKGERFAVITHSTGGPVVRLWWHLFYLREGRHCPMSHLVMLAPANFGSALAQVGKGWASSLKSFFHGVEPGDGVLDWLELGSPESWALNHEWMSTRGFLQGEAPVFPFVLTGQSIDRKLYDHLNSYTGEMGSDGVVRVAAANLNAHYVRLVQKKAPADWDGGFVNLSVSKEHTLTSAETVMGLVAGRSHSGEKMGIMRSVKAQSKSHPTVQAILRCLKVGDEVAYTKLAASFRTRNERVIEEERVEHVRKIGPDTTYHHPPCSMVVIRIQDDRGYPVPDFRLLLTGDRHSEDLLPEGFFLDRQQNSREGNTLTFFLNHEAMNRARRLGFKLTARPDEGFSHYLPAQLRSSRKAMEILIRPHETTLVDIVLRRVVHHGALRFSKGVKTKSFKNEEPGGLI